MATRMAASNAPKAQAARSSGRRYTLALALAVIAAVAVWPPTAMVFAVGMLPTLVAAVVDRSAGKMAACCVGLLNLCGVLPFVLQLWSRGQTVTAAERLLADAFNLSAMFGTAAAGWLLFLAIPPVVAAVLRVQADHRAATLRSRQKKLVEEWGDAVAGPSDRR